LFRSERVKLVTGAGYFTTQRKTAVNQEFLFFLIDPTLPAVPTFATDNTDVTTEHGNVYVYSYINPLKAVTLTIGGSGDFFNERGFVDKNQINPKLGITWNPIPDTTIRAAYFRNFKRTLVTNQTLEPTQLAGFNQFFDDIDATDSWTWGIGVDQKFSRSMYGGAEYSERDLKVPFSFTSINATGELVSEVRRADWSEKVGRAYLYWAPQNWLALTTEYQYERFERAAEQTGVEGVKELTTQRVPVGINLFHPSGFSVMVKGTYFDQKGEFRAGFDVNNNPIFVSGKENFWLCDASVSYRLPRRFGLVTIGAKNLFDKKFQYADMDPVSPIIQPKRFLYVRASFAF
jgi:outer membrane receptor protein involved in Fe transport